MKANKNPAKRVVVFIDHTNVFHRLLELKKIDLLWETWYNPKKLADCLVGNRKLVSVYFYCSPPPSYLLKEGNKGKTKYWKQIKYYEAIKQLEKVEVKYGRIAGIKGNLHEKNLDTQLNTDLLILGIQNKYDVAILISNDGDYESAVSGVKELGKKFELGYFKHKVSWNLKKVSDVSRKMRRSYFEKLDFEIKQGA
ncbi:MAG: NYN domain-containing protein [bacterium]|nr:NYN domain-containing protein [bacterium]